ncbi:ABC transporter ATP-binding protein [Pelistega indica]|uniref:ABC transporter ATP-binding protein n=1 Tax=Pelistega indica TaxID=1414851 RepID=V8G2K0_9BURK|nr:MULTISPECIES: ABC transporter ATP-binding protein [Pelistega]ETD70749.1 ABC transporter ATP-binding protein [Pelistega indica]
MAKLVLENVSKVFADQKVVDSVSLTVESGTFLALLGPSGCGKTTVLRMIAGFEPVSEGRILLDDKEISTSHTNIPPEQREMSMVFQSYALWPHMNVMDNVGYALKIKGVKGEAYLAEVNDALIAVNMAHLAKRMPNELSGGQRQRVALARCLVSHPKIVLLDEPLANLDQYLRASMEDTFREFQAKTNATFIYVTHDQAEAMALADKIAVMKQGVIEQFDSPQSLYQTPCSEWVARFIGQGSILKSSARSPEKGKQLSKQTIETLLAPGTFSANQLQTFLVRPQHIHLAQEGQGLQALIFNRVFKGERYAYKARLHNDQEILFFSESYLPLNKTIYLTIEQGYLLGD